MGYEIYEKEKNEIVKKNEVYLNEFKKWLTDKGLVSKTIDKHLENVEFYINEYLNYYEPTEMEEGCYDLNSFLGDWFIRKCLWSTASSIKENAASIKKFYKCMVELGYVDKNVYQELVDEIKECMDEWLEAVDDYDDDCFYF